MTNKQKALESAVFYAHEDPKPLATILASLIEDVATYVTVVGPTSIVLDTTEGSTAEYIGAVLNQYRDKMADDVTLSLKEEVTGISISGSTVTIANTVVDNTTFTVVAKSGDLTSEITTTVFVAE